MRKKLNTCNLHITRQRPKADMFTLLPLVTTSLEQTIVDTDFCAQNSYSTSTRRFQQYRVQTTRQRRGSHGRDFRTERLWRLGYRLKTGSPHSWYCAMPRYYASWYLRTLLHDTLYNTLRFLRIGVAQLNTEPFTVNCYRRPRNCSCPSIGFTR